MQFHKFSEEYPLMPAHELGRLEQAMRDRGYDKRFPIVRYQGKILDGRNRWLAAQAAKVKPPVVDFKGDDDAAQQFVITANEERRHLAPQWLEQRRRDRVDRVAEARREGKSTRVIAAEEGVSQGQVMRDLAAATESGDSVEPPNGQVVGKDKKKRSASGSKVKKQGKNGHSTVKGLTVEPSDADETVILDAEGEPVPEQARDAFLRAADMQQVGRDIDGIGQRVKAISETPAGRLVQYEDVRLHLKNAKGGVLQNRPTHVCPLCQGKRKDCQCCKGTGWTVEHVWKRLTAEAKR
jgi:hypothetical protein